jgi:beta-galactosidase
VAEPASVTITSATARDGRRIHFVHNWSWEPATIRIPTPVRDLLSASEHEIDESVSLSAWDVRIFAER